MQARQGGQIHLCFVRAFSVSSKTDTSILATEITEKKEGILVQLPYICLLEVSG